MPCFKPLHGFRRSGGGWTSNAKYAAIPESPVPLVVPCGRCIGCRLQRSYEWAVRSMHEISLYDYNCFITLTYNDDNLPLNASLDYKHFQDFMKRLRDRFHYRGLDLKNPIRFYMCGEYGEQRGRPHYHAILFNFDFTDKYHWATRNGNASYRSQTLEELWPFGNCEIGDANYKSAAYVARYIMKKQTGDQAWRHYDIVDPGTGEVFERIPEFNKCSLKPGIGSRWFDKYRSDVFPHDFVVVNGHTRKVPRYYDKLLDKLDSRCLDDVKARRADRSDAAIDNSTRDRLQVREKVALARLSQLPRTLK